MNHLEKGEGEGRREGEERRERWIKGGGKELNKFYLNEEYNVGGGVVGKVGRRLLPHSATQLRRWRGGRVIPKLFVEGKGAWYHPREAGYVLM